MARLNGAMGGTLDGASFVLSQSYYGGNVRGRPRIETRLVDGEHIDLLDGLDATAIGKGRRRADPEIDGLLDGSPAAATVGEPDDSGSGVVMRLARRVKQRWGTKEEFERAAWADERARAHLLKEEHTGRGRAQRALMRAWARVRDRVPLEDILEEEPDAPAHTGKPSRLSFLSPGQCADTPSRGYVIKGMLAPRDVACIFGNPGAGKSLIAPYLGYKLARGEAAFGMRTKAGGVFYVAAEDPHGMKGRVSALRMTHGDADGFTLVEGVSDLLSSDSPDLRDLMAAVAERKPALIVIDTLAMAFPGLEENSAEGMGRVVAVGRKLTEHEAAVVFIHHDTKAEGATPRGHSLFNGALDMAMQVTRDESGIVRGKLTKNRNGSCDLDIAFRIGTVETGTDEDGDPITFAHACELDGPAPRKIERLNSGERVALDILEHLSGNEREQIGALEGVPGHSRPVPEEKWRDICIEDRRISAAEDRNSRRRMWNKVKQALVRKGRVGYVGGNYYPIDIADGLDADLKFGEGEDYDDLLS